LRILRAKNYLMAGRICLGLVLAILLESSLGCGKEQPQPQKGVNQFNKTEGKSPREKSKPKNPMMP
jgi:hypothetical protein